MTLTEFLLARIAEDEEAGKDPYVWQFRIARWEAECEAKRKIVAFHGSKILESCQEDGGLFPCRTLRSMAAIYADHPDYHGAAPTPCPVCGGAGVVDTSPPGAEHAPWLQTDTDCARCGGSGEITEETP